MMKKILFFLLLCSFVGQGQNSICIGKRIEIASDDDITRSVLVYLPPSYHDFSLKPTKYPVVYLLDAEANFNYFATLMDKLSQGIPNVPEMIIVGIQTSKRETDFTTNNDAFWKLITTSVIPSIKNEYRCNNFSIVVGHSLGGLAVAYALNNYTNYFNVYMAHDPSLWWEDNSGLKLFEDNKQKNFKGRHLYLSYSGEKVRHNGRSRHHEAIEGLQSLLKEGGCKDLQTYFKEYPNENHGTVQIMANIDFFRMLFAEMFIDRNEIEANPMVIKERYKALSEKLGYEFKPTEKYLKNTAKWLEKNGKEAEAKAVLSINK